MKKVASLFILIFGFTSSALAQYSKFTYTPKLRKTQTPVWSNYFDVSQIQPFKEGSGQVTWFTDSLSYNFAKNYSAGAYIGIIKPWKEMPDQPAVDYEDLALTVTRTSQNKIFSLTGGVALPVSNYSKKAGRRAALLAEPGFLVKKNNITFDLKTELAYYNNQYSSVEDAGVTPNEIYSIWTKSALKIEIGQDWYLRSRAQFYQSWNYEGDLEESYILKNGFGYKTSKTSFLASMYSFQDKWHSDLALMSRDTTAMSLVFGMTL